MSTELENLDGLQADVSLDDEFKVGEYDIEVIDERAPEDQREPEVATDDPDAEPTEEELQDVSARVRKRIDKLTFKYNDQRREAEAAIKMQEEAILYARKVQEENERMRQIMQEGENVLVNEVRERTKISVAQAQNNYQRALEEGDVSSVSQAQLDLNRAQIEQHQAEQYQPGQYVSPEPAAQYNPQQQPGAVQTSEDPVFNDWASKNEWFNKNKKMRDWAVAIHKDLEAEQNQTGVIVGSEAYYRKVDETMKADFPAFFGTEGTSEPAASPAPSVVAPVARQSQSSGQPRKVQLTDTQVNLAKRLKIPLEVYAREHLKIEGAK